MSIVYRATQLLDKLLEHGIRVRVLVQELSVPSDGEDTLLPLCRQLLRAHLILCVKAPALSLAVDDAPRAAARWPAPALRIVACRLRSATAGGW